MRNWIGAFSDGAILFPLLAALSMQGGFSPVVLLATAGLAYFSAGFLFRIPMPVQPLKAVAIAALAVGASSTEIRLSAALLAVFCLCLTFGNIDSWARRIPVSLIHELQLALGILLIWEGSKFGLIPGIWPWTIGCVALILTAPLSFDFPVLGLAATAGLVWAIITGYHVAAPHQVPRNLGVATPRFSIVLSLAVPQLALTFFNSALGTQDAARRYFGERADRVTLRRLLRSIGIGNLLSAAVGGLPFCHGSGGLTAHYRGGSRHWYSNVIIGSTLILLSLLLLCGHGVIFRYPLPLLGSLLIATGVFHMGLAKTTWRVREGKLKLISCGVAAALTRNMLWVLGVGVTIELGLALLKRAQGTAGSYQTMKEVQG